MTPPKVDGPSTHLKPPTPKASVCFPANAHIAVMWSPRPMRIFSPLIALSFPLASCSTAPDYPMHGPAFASQGFASIKDEVMLFESEAALVSKNLARCVSGIGLNGIEHVRYLHRQRVYVRGYLVKYRELSDLPGHVLQRKTFRGAVVPNHCLKDDVVVITQINRL